MTLLVVWRLQAQPGGPWGRRWSGTAGLGGCGSRQDRRGRASCVHAPAAGPLCPAIPPPPPPACCRAGTLASSALTTSRQVPGPYSMPFCHTTARRCCGAAARGAAPCRSPHSRPVRRSPRPPKPVAYLQPLAIRRPPPPSTTTVPCYPLPSPVCSPRCGQRARPRPAPTSAPTPCTLCMTRRRAAEVTTSTLRLAIRRCLCLR